MHTSHSWPLSILCDPRKARPDVLMHLVTFGSPRVGTLSFKSDFNKLINLRYLRVQNGCDPVTQVPYCGFAHVGQHLWLVPGCVATALCLDRPATPGKSTEENKDQPWPFNRQCCMPCGLHNASPFDGRTFGGPSNSPPWLSAASCYLGICCGCVFGSLCSDDHLMQNYIHVLSQPKANPYWHTVLTRVENDVIQRRRAKKAGHPHSGMGDLHSFFFSTY